MKRNAQQRFSPLMLASIFRSHAAAGIPDDFNLWPQVRQELERRRQPVRMAVMSLPRIYEERMEESLEPNQVWVWITCYRQHEQDAADALRQAFSTAGISEQLLDLVFPSEEYRNAWKPSTESGPAAGLPQTQDFSLFSSFLMAKITKTDAAAAVLRSGPSYKPYSGWAFSHIARPSSKPAVVDGPDEFIYKINDWVRILTWPFEGLDGKVMVVIRNKLQVGVVIGESMHPVYRLSKGEFVKIDQPNASTMEAQKRAWYVLYGYPKHENQLRDNLRKRLDQAGLLDHLLDITVSAQGQDSISMVKDGEVHTVYPSQFPGAVFVLLSFSNEVWEVVRQTPGLTGFVGWGNTPLGYPPGLAPDLTGHNQESRTAEAKSPVQQGDQVRIISGPFYNIRGIVIEVDEVRSKIRVMIDIFQRPTPVEVDYEQVEKA